MENQNAHPTIIHKDMTIDEIFSTFPERSQKIAQKLSNQGLSCVGCSASSYETLEVGMLSHGFSESDLEKMLQDLNQVISEPIDTSTITITETAAKKFKEFALKEGKPLSKLRFRDKPGGCSGFEYVLDFTETVDPDETVFTSNTVEICVHNDSVERLMGSEIDYQDGLNGAGFKISNPNAKSSCSCGQSQAY